MTMPICKNCKSNIVVKNGIVRGRQRYRCKRCMYNFIEGDRRINKKIDYNKTVYVVLYSLGNESFSTLSEVFDALPSLIYHWSVKAQSKLLEPHSDEIQEMEIDEMWHFIGLKKEDYVSSKPLIVAHGELGQGFLATIILQPSKDST